MTMTMMKIFVLSAAAGSAYAGSLSVASVEPVAAISRASPVGNRALQSSDLLCGSDTLIVGASGAGECPGTGLGGTVAAEWGPCCVFESKRADQCRVFEVENAFCDEEGGTDCSTLTTTDTLTLDMSWSFLAEDHECCKTCSCFGDPECVSFNGAENLWIPCDARDANSCRMQKTTCDTMVDANGNECVWRAGKKQDSRGWDVGMKGSPCWPVISDDPSKKLSMNMYTDESEDFKLDLVLGERGIIRQVEVHLNGDDYVMSAEDCFKKDDHKAWKINGKTAKDLPVEFALVTDTSKSNAAANTQRVWHIFDAGTETSTELLCSRAMGRRSAGIARINVQSINTSTERATKGAGFCSSGNIVEKKGEDSSDLHKGCVADAESALQACKNLVGWGVVDNQLSDCAKEYCNKAEVNDVDECYNVMGDGKSNGSWKRMYCQALVVQGQFSDAEKPHDLCMREMSQGWPFMVSTFGKGYRSVGEETVECASSWDDYSLENKRKCTPGINVETWSEADEAWTVQYFIPADKPFCDELDGSLSTNAVKTPILFKRKIRMTQCDVTAEEGCETLVSTCGKVPGSSFKLAFANSFTSLWDNREHLRCGPNPSDPDGTDPYWCLPWGAPEGADTDCDWVCQDDARRLLELPSSK